MLSHRHAVAIVGLVLTVALTGAPQSALASHSRQVPAAQVPVSRVPVSKAPGTLAMPKYQRMVAASFPVKYQRVVKTFNRPLRASRPVSFYRKTAGYGSYSRIHPRGHFGLDMAARRGTTVRAAIAGTVIFSGWDGAYGRKIVISHGNGLTTVYGHLNSITIAKGKRVAAGQRIGTVGSTGRSTGPHLHFEVRKYGQTRNPSTYMRTLGIRL